MSRRRMFISFILLAISLFCVSMTSFARDVWEERDGKWYFYIESDEADDAGNYTRENFHGWVRWDESTWYYVDDAEMMTGWLIINGKFYYFKSDGIMASDEWVGNFYVNADGEVLTDTEAPDGTRLSENGSKIVNGSGIVSLNAKTASYIEILKLYPDARIELSKPGSILQESPNGKRYMIFKTVSLYNKDTGALLYSGDGAFDLTAKIEIKIGDTISTVGVSGLYTHNSFTANRVFIDPSGLITEIRQD